MTKFLHFNFNEETKGNPKKYRKFFQSRTIAVESPDADTIKKLAKDFLESGTTQDILSTVKFGVTFCSFNDFYDKGIGRKKSLEKQTDNVLKVSGVTVTETHVFVNLQPYRGTVLTLRANRSTGFTTVVGKVSGGRDS